jgi:hypothetical protein
VAFLSFDDNYSNYGEESLNLRVRSVSGMPMKDSRTVSTLCLIAVLATLMPLAYFSSSVQAQLLRPIQPPSSAPSLSPPATKPITPKVAAASVTSPSNALKVDVILYGISNKTGNVVTFVFAKNHTDAVAFNASDDNIKHENSTGVAEAFFTLPNTKLKIGDKIEACTVSISDLKLVCGTGLKSPLNRTESVNIMVPSPSIEASNKSSG